LDREGCGISHQLPLLLSWVGNCKWLARAASFLVPGGPQADSGLPSPGRPLAAPAGAGLAGGLRMAGSIGASAWASPTRRRAALSPGTCCTAQFSRNRKAIIPVPTLGKLERGLSWHSRIAGCSLFRLCGSSSRWGRCSTSVTHEKAVRLVKRNGDTQSKLFLGR
jgi:hypothetical protein